MSIRSVNKEGLGDEYKTPKYIVEILLPYLKKRSNIKSIWCPFDKDNSEYVKVFKESGYKVYNTHIDNGEDFLNYDPIFKYDIIISNPPFSLKNSIINRCNLLNKPYALLLSATCIQSASLVRIIQKSKNFNFIIFDKRISYNGDRPPFPSWYFTSNFLDNNEFYIFKDKPKDLYKKWEESLKC